MRSRARLRRHDHQRRRFDIGFRRFAWIQIRCLSSRDAFRLETPASGGEPTKETFYAQRDAERPAGSWAANAKSTLAGDAYGFVRCEFLLSNLELGLGGKHQWEF
jgi:hypothetical protein